MLKKNIEYCPDISVVFCLADVDTLSDTTDWQLFWHVSSQFRAQIYHEILTNPFPPIKTVSCYYFPSVNHYVICKTGIDILRMIVNKLTKSWCTHWKLMSLHQHYDDFTQHITGTKWTYHFFCGFSSRVLTKCGSIFMCNLSTSLTQKSYIPLCIFQCSSIKFI